MFLRAEDGRRDYDVTGVQTCALPIFDELIQAAVEVNGVRIITYLSDSGSRETLRDFADQIRGKVESVALLLGTVIDDKVALTAAVSKDLVKRGVKASDCIKVAAKIVGGGGGGRPDLAEAGGKNPDKLPEEIGRAHV